VAGTELLARFSLRAGIGLFGVTVERWAEQGFKNVGDGVDGLVAVKLHTRNIHVYTDEGDRTEPYFEEIEIGIDPRALETLGLSSGGSGLFSDGLSARALTRVRAGGALRTADFAPDPLHPIRFPRIEFPSIVVSADRGDCVERRLEVSVAKMTPETPLKAVIGETILTLDMSTDGAGAARFALDIDESVGPGSTLLTIGSQNVEDALTADAVIDVCDAPYRR